jgi:ABC-type nitrate/sulfonate/bicarbonate transport system substrate-binding protein
MKAAIYYKWRQVMKCSQNKVLIFCLILGILAFAKPAYSKNLDIKVLMLKQTPIFWPFYIGLEKNYFAEEGVSITPIQLYRLAEIYKAIRNGSIDLAILPSTAVLLENEKSFFIHVWCF